MYFKRFNDRSFESLIENLRTVRAYAHGQQIQARPVLFLPGRYGVSHRNYAKQAGVVTADLSSRRQREGHWGTTSLPAIGSLPATVEKRTRRAFLYLTAGFAAVSQASEQQEPAYEFNFGPGFYRYVRPVLSSDANVDLGDVHRIAVWSDPDHKWKLKGPHRQLTSQDAIYPVDPVSPIWVPSDKATDGMQYLRFMHIDTYSWLYSRCGQPKTFRWITLPIDVYVNEGSNREQITAEIATTIRKALPLWDYKGLRFFREVPVDPTHRDAGVKFQFCEGNIQCTGALPSGRTCKAIETGNVWINKGRYDLKEPWFYGVIVHELGHILGLLGHAPWPVSLADRPNGQPNASKDIMTIVWPPNPATRFSLFNLETVYKLYGGEIPNETVLDWYVL